MPETNVPSGTDSDNPMTATELSLFTGVSIEEALHRVLTLAEVHHLDGLDSDHGLNAICLEIVAQFWETLVEPEALGSAP